MLMCTLTYAIAKRTLPVQVKCVVLMLDWDDEEMVCDLFQVLCEAIKYAPALLVAVATDLLRVQFCLHALCSDARSSHCYSAAAISRRQPPVTSLCD